MICIIFQCLFKQFQILEQNIVFVDCDLRCFNTNPGLHFLSRGACAPCPLMVSISCSCGETQFEVIIKP